MESINNTQNRLHAAWMWYKSTETTKQWKPVYSILKDNVLFFFTSEKTNLENHIGTLHLNKDSSFHYGDGNPKEGFRFELHAPKKKSKFRVKTVYEREVWRAYLEGIITGEVPQGVVLSPQDTKEIKQKLLYIRHQPSPHSQDPPTSSTQRHRQPVPDFSTPSPRSSLHHSASMSSSTLSAGSGAYRVKERRPSQPSLVSTGSGNSSGGEFDVPGLVSYRDLSNSSGESRGSSGYYGGPFMHHKFSATDNGNVPSWFFEECSRELAEKILTQNHHMGNTLMRVSNTARDTGSYAISKRMESSGIIAHYEVIRVAEGFRINVENCHKAMKTLTEVMNFFIELSGPATTRPLRTNKLQELGINYSDYSRRIDVQPEARKPADDSEADENYEVPADSPRGMVPPSVPAPPPPPLVAPGSKAPYKTWGREKSDEASSLCYYQDASSRTLGPKDRKQTKANEKPSAMEFNHKLQEHDAVQKLDVVLRKEETKAQVCEASTAPSDIPPPLPPVQPDRPRLNSVDLRPALYQNQSESATDLNARDDSPEDDAPHPRWNKRSQSVPNVVFPTELNVLGLVSANITPPSLVKPPGAKVAPPTAPKTTRLHHHSNSDLSQDGGNVGARGMTMPNTLVEELQKKLGVRKEACKEVEDVAVRQLPPTPSLQQQHSGEALEEEELYEDPEKYYQNIQ